MATPWFVKPETVRLDLEFKDAAGNVHPFWLDVKRQLTVGEARRYLTTGWGGVRGARGGVGREMDINWVQMSFAKVATWIHDWSLADDQNVKYPVTQAVIEQMAPALYEVIEAAVDAHEEKMAAEKKTMNAAPTSKATST